MMFPGMKVKVAVAMVAAAFAATAPAQQPDAKGGAVLKSEPGKVTAARGIEVSAQVVSIDKATRTVTLKGPKGEAFDLVAGDEVKNFDQVKVGDVVVAKFAQALTLELRKTKGKTGEVGVTDAAARAKPGETPGGVVGRQITAIADVVAVDPKKSTMTFKGPRGNVVTVDVQNPDQFKVVKKGDQVQVTYTEAVALSLEPAPKAAGKQ